MEKGGETNYGRTLLCWRSKKVTFLAFIGANIVENTVKSHKPQMYRYNCNPLLQLHSHKHEAEGWVDIAEWME